MQNPIIATSQVPLVSVKSTSARGFKPLVIGSTLVDEVLARHRVPKGSLLHFDFIGAPDMHLLALLRAAIERGESVALVYVPTKGHLSGHRSCKDVRTPNPAACPLREQMGYYDLQGFLNEANPTDPAARLRYFVALTPDELEEDLDTLLGVSRDDETTGEDLVVPDLIVVYGVDQLFTVKGLSKKGVSSRLKRLGRLVDTYSARCAETGSTLWFGRSLDFHEEDAPPIVGAINDLLYERCHFGLTVDLQLLGEGTCTRTCADYRQGRRATVRTEGQVVNNPGNSEAWQISLYKGNALLESLRLTYIGETFLDSESAIEDEEAFDSTNCGGEQGDSTPSFHVVQSLTKAAETLAIATRDLAAAIESLRTA